MASALKGCWPVTTSRSSTTLEVNKATLSTWAPACASASLGSVVRPARCPPAQQDSALAKRLNLLGVDSVVGQHRRVVFTLE